MKAVIRRVMSFGHGSVIEYQFWGVIRDVNKGVDRVRPPPLEVADKTSKNVFFLLTKLAPFQK